MRAKDAIKHALTSNHHVMKMYLSDLSDGDLLVRPAPGANHIAWQLGHVIGAESMFLGRIPGAAAPPLPAGFADAHKADRAKADTPDGFLGKEQYLGLLEKVRAATLTALEDLPDADLDKPSPVMPEFAPTLGALFLLMASHQMMHAGQFTVLRRKLGKPVLF